MTTMFGRVAMIVATVSAATVLASPPKPTPDQVEAWAKTYYPAIVTAKQLPDGVNIGFLFDRELRVAHHSLAIQPRDGVGVLPDDLDQLFPAHKFDMSTVEALCYQAKPGRPRHCIIWAQVAE